MLRGITKDVSVLVTELRSFPVIETNWETYPCYYEVISPIIVQTSEGIKLVRRGDYLVWGKEGNFEVFKSKDWQNLFGKFLKENLKGGELIEKKS